MVSITPPILTRFAPSPTGYLHLGHVAHALCVWKLAERLGAKVLLRIEDHDRGRCRPEYEASILQDLEWLGFQPDVGLISEFRAGPCSWRQSDRHAVYDSMLLSLAARHTVYACTCSRKEVLQRTGQDPAGELRYDGYCRHRGLRLAEDVGIRIALPAHSVTFEDLLCGCREQSPLTQCGDLLLRDRHGNWTYQFAVVVDDLLQGVNLVIRGVDLLESTGRQLILAEMLERTQPLHFAHHPLLLDTHGKKLSKRSFATSVAQLREQGRTAQDLLREAQQFIGTPWDSLDL